MKDPTSDLGEDLSPSDVPDCAVCGDSLVDVQTRRTVTWVEDGGVERVEFCSDECRTEWDDTQW